MPSFKVNKLHKNSHPKLVTKNPMSTLEDILKTGKPKPLIESAYLKVESLYDALGLMSGSSAPAKRALFTGVVFGGAVYALKPKFAFSPNGQVRPWVITSPDNPNSTPLPWWYFAAAGAILGGVFI